MVDSVDAAIARYAASAPRHMTGRGVNLYARVRIVCDFVRAG